MAKKRAATVSRKSGADVVVVNSPSPPARRRSSGSPARRGGRRGGAIRRRASAALNASRSIEKRVMGSGMGGFAVGFLEKTFGDKIPNLPYIGRKGTVALAVYFMKPKSQLIQDIGVAAAALAGYQLAREGKIEGEDDDGVDGDLLTT